VPTASLVENARRRFWGESDMQDKPPHMILSMLKAGLFFGALVFVLIIAIQIVFPTMGRYLEATTNGLAILWHESGLPPSG